MIELLRNDWESILLGLFATIRIVGIGFATGAAAGVLMGPARDSRYRPLRWIVGIYVEAIRNTPFLVQASLLFALLGVVRLRVAPELVGIVSIALYTAAYMAEIVRGALRTITNGQWEGAKALGLGRVLTFRKVILPQLLPYSVPASANLLATVTKESAFLSALSVVELTYSGQVVIARTFQIFQVWALLGLLYLLLILSLFALSKRLERRFVWARNSRS